MRARRALFFALSALLVGRLTGVVAGEAADTRESALKACSSIAADAARLACYDRLARPEQSNPAPQNPPAATPAAKATPAPKPADSFGLYAAEHPKPPPAAPALESVVVALGKSPRGRISVSLKDGAVWELDEADPLLAVGDTVTITRAALGSFLMRTPSQRTHRVRRLQ